MSVLAISRYCAVSSCDNESPNARRTSTAIAVQGLRVPDEIVNQGPRGGDLLDLP
jgi:hypothetical protein